MIDRALRTATLTIAGPTAADAGDAPGRLTELGCRWWPLDVCRQFDDALLHLRLNEADIGTWLLRTEGDPDAVRAVDAALAAAADDWRVREIRLYWARTLRRLELSARSLVALVEPGSCFAGTLAELAWAADRSLQHDDADGTDERGPATLTVDAANDGWYPTVNGLTRLQSRFWGHDDALAAALATAGKPLDAQRAAELGLVTAAVDDIDWDDELRLLVTERAGFSADALTAMEANLRLVGPETMESKIFGRLTAWQNWVFSRPNATGAEGALMRYGSGSRPNYDRSRT